VVGEFVGQLRVPFGPVDVLFGPGEIALAQLVEPVLDLRFGDGNLFGRTPIGPVVDLVVLFLNLFGLPPEAGSGGTTGRRRDDQNGGDHPATVRNKQPSHRHNPFFKTATVGR